MKVDLHWTVDAACRDHDPELFFPHPTHDATRQQAIAVCRSCPVVAACQRYVDTFPAGHVEGVWAGKAYAVHGSRPPRIATCRVCHLEFTYVARGPARSLCHEHRPPQTREAS